MAIAPEIKNLIISDELKISAKNAVECRINISEEEASNVVWVSGKAVLNFTECHQNEVVYGGKVTFNAITDLGGLKKCEAGVEFSYKTIVDGVCDLDLLVAEVLVENVKISMQNGLPTVTAAIVLTGSVKKQSQIKYVKCIEGAYCKNAETKNLVLVQSDTKTFNLEDEFDLDFSVQEVLWHDEKIKVKTVKSEISTVSIEGEVELSALLLGVDDKKPTFEKRTIPFSLEQEVSKAMPDLIATTSPLIKSANLKVVVDKVKEKSVVSVQVEICFFTEIYENESVTYLCDAYSSKNYLEFEKCEKKTVFIDEQNLFEENVAFKSCVKKQKNSRLICPLFAKIEQSQFEMQIQTVNGMLEITALFSGESGYFVDSTLLPFTVKVDNVSNDIKLNGVNAINLSATETDEEISYSATICGIMIKRTANSVLFVEKVEEGKEIVCNDNAISVYVPNKNDTLWDLSKALGVSEEDILKINPELNFPLSGEERVVVYREINKVI